MSEHHTQLVPFRKEFRESMIALWEKSVKATHHFVLPEDIIFFKELVRQIDFESFSVYCLLIEDKVAGFIGVSGSTIETLFLDPDYIGQGFGKRLLQFAIEELNAVNVEVNEQNLNAVQFYLKFGFSVYERTDKDPEGKPYPVLKMRRMTG